MYSPSSLKNFDSAAISGDVPLNGAIGSMVFLFRNALMLGAAGLVLSGCASNAAEKIGLRQTLALNQSDAEQPATVGEAMIQNSSSGHYYLLQPSIANLLPSPFYLLTLT